MNYIILDTNCLFKSFKGGTNYAEFRLNRTYYDLIEFLSRHEVCCSFTILIPEIVLMELCKQQCDCYYANLTSLRNNFKGFANLNGFKLEVNDMDYKNYINNFKDDYIKKESINVLKICNMSVFKEIVARAVNKNHLLKGKTRFQIKDLKIL